MSFSEKLMDKYPHLFYQDEEGKSYCPCGIWVPEGWEPIIDMLCGSITHRMYHVRKYDAKGERVPTPDVKIEQIKEKFGGLRFYYSGGDDEISGMVSFAEFMSEHTCEVSGDTGSLCSRNGWLKTLSPAVCATPEYKDYKPKQANG